MAVDGGKGRVLIVDDEVSILSVLEQFLSQRGYDVRCCENASQAFHALMEENFDIALVDLKLPDRSGIEIVREIRRKQGYKLLSDPSLVYHERELPWEAIHLGFSRIVCLLPVCLVLQACTGM